ncbi:hypothetical protein WJX75_006235 [Coccomyxa subellipsoidea]|uniref:Uncharacterized protein n=1 Tax=Coccomyxa subellipsoidea TaxID=248742 RepID=A0ABR2YRP2_9CHLO
MQFRKVRRSVRWTATSPSEAGPEHIRPAVRWICRTPQTSGRNNPLADHFTARMATDGGMAQAMLSPRSCRSFAAS